MATDNDLASYNFDLPEDFIAQRPAERRDASRLMAVMPDGERRDCVFSDLPELLSPGDILVRNNVRVLPARLLGRRRGGGGAELLLVRRLADADESWLCLARPGNRFKPGRQFFFGDGDELVATVKENDAGGMVAVSFSLRGPEFMSALERIGQVPLPPYIVRADKRPTPEDGERYQTHYAAEPGAVAAPTAGLHFTPELDRRLAERGVGIAELTLNVGPGTFRPIKENNLDNHVMHAEWCRIPAGTWRKAKEARRCGGRVVAVGTTAVRSMESAALAGYDEEGGGDFEAWTNLFIRPGHVFRAIDGMVTNFHLPGSSLVVLVSALAGRERILDAYRDAIAKRCRFYSYGDAMLLWPPAART